MLKRVADALRTFLAGWKRARRMKTSGIEFTIMKVHRVQTWFLHHRGAPMAQWDCQNCGKARTFTIWSDGKYHCIACLYGQARRKEAGPIPLDPPVAATQEFMSSWEAYRKHAEVFEDPWTKPSNSALQRLSRLSRLRPPAICTIGECQTCQACRPFMRREDGDAGCISCLMQGRIIEFEIETADETVAA